MRRPRVSIRGLMALVLLVALALAAMRNPSPALASLVTSATFLILCGATLGALVRRGDRRPNWLGFSLFGWAYLYVYTNHWSTTSSFPSPNLFPCIVFVYFQPMLSPNLQNMPTPISWEPSPDYSNYRWIAQGFVTLLVGVGGSILGRSLADGGSTDAPPLPPPPSSSRIDAEKTGSGDNPFMHS